MEDTAPDALPVETEGVAAAPGPAPGAAAAPAPAAMFQTFVPSPTRKKSVTVRRQNEKYRPKKTVLVARKPREDDLLDRNRMSNVASPARLKGLRRLPRNAGVIERSVLGEADKFVEHEVYCKYGDDGKPDTPASSRARTPSDVFPVEAFSAGDLTTDESYVDALKAKAAEVEIIQFQETAARDDSTFIPDAEDTFGGAREARALKRWKEQQKDWRRLTATFAKKQGKPVDEVLMMKSCEDYREQSENFQIIQASIPQEESAGESYWEMNLRGEGQRMVRVGNLFSGLYCPLKKGEKAPQQIRRPKLPGSAAGLTTRSLGEKKDWRSDPYMLKRKKQWEKGLKTLQPHLVGSGDDATELAVVGTDLFRWAADASEDVLNSRNVVSEPPTIVEEEPEEEVVQVKPLPRLEVIGNALLHLEATHSGKAGKNSVTLKNTSDKVMFFEWRLNSKGPERAPDDELWVERGPKYKDGTPMDDKVFATNKDCFFQCMTPSGSILPGCETICRFAFKSRVPGCFVEEWQLKVRPKAEITGLIKLSNAKKGKKCKKRQGVSLQGYQQPPEDKPHMRDHVDAILEKHVGPDICREILYEVLWDVDLSPAGAERARNASNKAKLEARNARRGLVFTPDRWAAFEELRKDARTAKKEIEAPEEEITEEEACAPAPAPGPAPAVEEAAPLPARRLEPREVDVFGHKADQDVVAPPPPVPEDWDPEALGLPDWMPPVPPIDPTWGLGAAREKYRKRKEAAKPDPDEWDGDIDAIEALIASISIPEVVEDEALTVATREKGSDDDEEEDEEEEEEEDEDEDEDTLATGAPPRKPAPPADPRERRILSLKMRFTSLLASCSTTADEDCAIDALKPHLDGVIEKAAFALTTCEAVAALEDTKPPAALGEDPDALNGALEASIAASDAVAALPPPKVWDSAQMKYVDGPKVVQDLAREEGLEDFGAACVTGEGQDAYRAAACASVKRLLADMIGPPSPDEEDAPDDATAATFPAPPARRPNAVHDAIAQRAEDIASIQAARPEDVDGKVVLLQADLDVSVDEDIDEDDLPEAFQRVAKTLETLTAAKAVLIVTELAEGSTKSLVEPLIHAAGPDWAPRFVGDIARAKAILEKMTDEDEDDATPLFILEARNSGPALCTVIDREIVVDEDAPALPYWADADDAEAAEACENAFRENDAGYRLTELADILVQDSLNAFMPTYNVERMHDADARSLQLCTLPRSLGLNAHLDTATVSRLLSGPRPIVAVVGDDRVQGCGFLRQARLVDFLLDHADEVLLSGLCARECLAALNVDVGRGVVDEAVFPVARRLMAKAVRRKVALRLPCDFATGDIDVDEKGQIKVSEDDDDEEDESEEEEEEEDDDEDGDAGGFEYDGDISDAALEGAGAKNGVPRDVFALDIGQQTIDSFRASLNRAATIFWSGAVGSVECAAFQQGTRDVAEACAEAAAERKALVVIAGRTATTWARNFAPDEDEDAESGVCLVDADGRNAFSHILCGGPFAPCLDAVPKREPTDDERLLPAELAQKQREAAEASDEDEDEDDEGDY